MDRSDEQLLAESGRDRAAFGVFYERHERAVLGFFGAVTRRPELAADLTAETFAAALDGVDRFDPERGTARMWLFGIARNVLSGSARRGRVETAARRRIGLETLVLAPSHVELIEALVTAEGDAIVEAWLAELPPDQAAALRARVLDEREYADIASDLRCSEAVVRQRVSRGLGRLRRMLGEGAR
ncbi:RNA polymerase sigma factor [Solirubrobacter sp. CPCC 204708]|uniref:RNA polymerase sigma factor n=1 Tax=Solirubrobacter deserti TaxID=2282478 RepID=A0ABT4RCI0_9ACTN|nr:RNA polymerase sigma factor [Solirubrobacter deserti]MBE2315605.1 RNA polymerase sigma factor [Solirubrobacter deserti]MDA0136244.1 RNA polymerase sigma factor [Solirubrobacter deserti]